MKGEIESFVYAADSFIKKKRGRQTGRVLSNCFLVSDDILVYRLSDE